MESILSDVRLKFNTPSCGDIIKEWLFCSYHFFHFSESWCWHNEFFSNIFTVGNVFSKEQRVHLASNLLIFYVNLFSENFTMSIVYRGCAEVDSNFVTSCYQSEGTDWTALQINTDMPNFQEACTAGYFTGTICHNVSAVDSKGKSVHRIDCYCFIVQLFVSVVLITLML